MSLLEKAKAHKTKKPHAKVSDEDIELAFAWLRSEVNTVQIAAAYGSKNGSTMIYKMAVALKFAYEKGLIEIIES